MRSGTKNRQRTHSKNKGSRKPGEGLSIKRSKTESRVGSNSNTLIAFRPDLLNNYTPAEKSGFLLPCHFGGEYYDKHHIISEWNAIFQKHFHQIMVDENDSFETILSTLQNQTSEVVSSKEWRLKIISEDDLDLIESELHAFEVIGQVEVAMMPLDWIDTFKLADVRELMFGIVYKIATSYKIDLIFGDIINAELWNFKDLKSLRNHLIDFHGESEDIEKMIENYWSYKIGRPAQLLKELRDYKNQTIKGLFDQFKECRKNHPKLKLLMIWIEKGLNLLSEKIIPIDEFIYNPYTNREDEAIQMEETIFFPYSCRDELFEQSENWLNDRYNNYGAADVYQYTIYTSSGKRSSKDYSCIINLVNWMEQSHKIITSTKTLWS